MAKHVPRVRSLSDDTFKPCKTIVAVAEGLNVIPAHVRPLVVRTGNEATPDRRTHITMVAGNATFSAHIVSEQMQVFVGLGRCRSRCEKLTRRALIHLRPQRLQRVPNNMPYRPIPDA